MLPDADITIASLNSLHDLALNCILFFFFFFAGKQIYQTCARQKHLQKFTLAKTHKETCCEYVSNHRHSHSDGISYLRGTLSMLKNSMSCSGINTEVV